MTSKLSRALLALSLGAAGGALAFWAALPLAWMIGSMLAVTAAAVGGLPVALPLWMRNLFIVVLGVMLGSSFRPEIFDQLGEWTLSLVGLVVYSVVAASLGMVYLRRVSGYSGTTAYFSAMPGGLSEMILVGAAMGGDARVISLMHASRILLVVITLPFAFQLLLGYDPANRPSVGAPLAAVAWLDLLILALCGFGGMLAARLARVPAAFLVGPMLFSAATHLAGWTAASPPAELVAAAQVVIGSAIGCRFAGTRIGFMLRVVASALGLTLLLLLLSLGFAYVMHAMTGLPTPYLILAYAPGGLAEMSLVALALSFDAAFVATHHIVRIFLVVILAPLAFRLGAARSTPAGNGPQSDATPPGD